MKKMILKKNKYFYLKIKQAVLWVKEKLLHKPKKMNIKTLYHLKIVYLMNIKNKQIFYKQN